MSTSTRHHRHGTTGRHLRRVVAAIALATTGALVPAVAGATPATPSAPACVNAPDAKARAASEVNRRLGTIDQLTSALAGAPDPYGVNAAQGAALAQAKVGLSALGQKISTDCYANREVLAADVRLIFTDYRIYALRVPQTHALEAAGHLGQARTKLGEVSTKLAARIGSNATAAAALAAMNQALSDYDAKVGAPPQLAGSMAAVPGLQPAVDTGPTTAALKAARVDLQAGRASLALAKAKATEAVQALKG